jgi:homoserine kinase type II
MSVFTPVSFEELSQWIVDYPVGELKSIKGIASGITNTNYFVTTHQGRYVLTLFEEHSVDELPFFLNLMRHLAERGIPCPHPVQRRDGLVLDELNGKPAALVTCLLGSDIEEPEASHCEKVGRVLADMHLKGRDFAERNHDTRDLTWRLKTADTVLKFLDLSDQTMMKSVLAEQASMDLSDLPSGIIHADLFRDNVLFNGSEVGGIIDFYYACYGSFIYDLAIAVNDWCVSNAGIFVMNRAVAMLKGYESIRKLTDKERNCWPVMLKFAAIRFWLSRLKDQHFPHDGELTHAKDPQHFQKILKWHCEHQIDLANMMPQ